MMAIKKTDKSADDYAERKKVIKVMLEEWGEAKRIEWRQLGLGHKMPASVAMICASKCFVLREDVLMDRFKRLMGELRSYCYHDYQTAKNIYWDEESPKYIARKLGINESTVSRRINNAIRFIDIHWREP